MKYEVAITEIKRKIVCVEANNEPDARARVADAWRNNEVILNENDFEGFEVYVTGEASTNNSLFQIESKD